MKDVSMKIEAVQLPSEIGHIVLVEPQSALLLQFIAFKYTIALAYLVATASLGFSVDQLLHPITCPL